MEDGKTKLSCETSRKVKVEDVKTKLSCETSFNFWSSSCAKRRLKRQLHCGTDPTMIRPQPNVFRICRVGRLPHPGHVLSCKTQLFVHPLTFTQSNCRASQGVSRRSYRLFLFFIGLSLTRNFRHPACPGSTCTDNHLYIKKPMVYLII